MAMPTTDDVLFRLRQASETLDKEQLLPRALLKNVVCGIQGSTSIAAQKHCRVPGCHRATRRWPSVARIALLTERHGQSLRRAGNDANRRADYIA